MSEQLRTAKYVALLLDCGVDHVYVLARTGQLAAVRAGHKFLRFRDEDIDAYIAAHLNPAAWARSSRTAQGLPGELTEPETARAVAAIGGET